MNRPIKVLATFGGIVFLAGAVIGCENTPSNAQIWASTCKAAATGLKVATDLNERGELNTLHVALVDKADGVIGRLCPSNIEGQGADGPPTTDDAWDELFEAADDLSLIGAL